MSETDGYAPRVPPRLVRFARRVDRRRVSPAVGRSSGESSNFPGPQIIFYYNSKREQPYIKNIIPSPALFSYYILWGSSVSIKKNIQQLNKLLIQSGNNF